MTLSSASSWTGLVLSEAIRSVPICVDADLVVLRVASTNDATTAESVRTLWRGWAEQRRRLVAPRLLLYEVTNALHRLAIVRSIPREDAIDAISLAHGCLSSFFTRWTFTNQRCSSRRGLVDPPHMMPTTWPSPTALARNSVLPTAVLRTRSGLTWTGSEFSGSKAVRVFPFLPDDLDDTRGVDPLVGGDEGEAERTSRRGDDAVGHVGDGVSGNLTHSGNHMCV